MAFQTGSLLEEITNVDGECSQLLQDAGIVEDEDLKSLCYESLKDIFPGNGKKIIQRSKVWKIIQKSLKTEETSTVSSPSSFNSVELSDDRLDSSSFFDNDVVEVSTPKPAKRVKVEHPEYTVYVDSEIRDASKSGAMSKDLKCRLVRATIHNMISTAASPPFCRYPLTMEIEEMAKSLIIAYPCLRDPETDHGDLFKKLKRKLSNSKPTKKPQGPCPNKKRTKENVNDLSSNPKITDYLSEMKAQSTSSPAQVEVDCNSESCDENNVAGIVKDNVEVMKRHYSLLQREMNKKKPNKQIVNAYLNKEFQSRRNWLKSVSAEERCKMILESYPCFTDHVEIIEEVRRVLEVETAEQSQFVRECVGRLTDELDFLMFYGISKGIKPPQSPKLSAKVVHVLKKLSAIFPRPKPLKKAAELVYELQDHEDPDSYRLKQSGNLPVLLVDQESFYIVVGKMILSTIAKDNVAEAIVGFLASFYLLDFDYPKQHEFGLVMLQTIIFRDERVPIDILQVFQVMVKAFEKYKAQ